MERKRHIEAMKVIGKMLDGVNLPEKLKGRAMDYANKIATDPQAQAWVRANNKSDLAERDIKRCIALTKHAAKPPQSVTTPTPVMTQTKPPQRTTAPTPAKRNDGLLLEKPFFETEAAHYATQEYFNEFRKMPAEDFDLESYWKAHTAKLQAEYEARRKKHA
jgi:hypothetical protein